MKAPPPTPAEQIAITELAARYFRFEQVSDSDIRSALGSGSRAFLLNRKAEGIANRAHCAMIGAFPVVAHGVARRDWR